MTSLTSEAQEYCATVGLSETVVVAILAEADPTAAASAQGVAPEAIQQVQALHDE